VDKVVVDVPDGDHDRELRFWEGATGVAMRRFDKHPEYHGAHLPGHGIGMLVQRLGDGPGRVHLDIHTDDLDAEVARLERLGAERVRQVNAWWVMRDPAGLPFCVIPEPPGSMDDGNATRWD
jgi:predicted enzyme related to lactoylglutathione lyase